MRKIDRTVCRGVEDGRRRRRRGRGSICVHVGTNDADMDGTTAIVGKFRELVRVLKARRDGMIVVSKDGLHMADRGAEVLGACLATAMGSGVAPF